MTLDEYLLWMGFALFSTGFIAFILLNLSEGPSEPLAPVAMAPGILFIAGYFYRRMTK